MISMEANGDYEVVETKHKTKVLYLDDVAYAWIHPKHIGEILVSSHHFEDSDVKISAGKYMLYDVDNEDYLTDLQHLELEYGHDAWQGYLLPTGLPTGEKKRARIIPTDQIITHSDFFNGHLVLNKPKILTGIQGVFV